MLFQFIGALLRELTNVLHEATKQHISSVVRRTIERFGIDEAARFTPSWYVDCSLEGFKRAVQRGVQNTPRYNLALAVKNDLDNNRNEVEQFIAGLLGMM